MTSESPGKLAFSVPEVARMLGCSPAAVWRAVWEGELRSVKLRGRRLVPRAAIDALLNGEGLRAGLRTEMGPR